MRIMVCIIVLITLATSVVAQEQTFITSDPERRAFGGPVVKFTSIDDQSAIMIGGRGGWILNRSLAIGGGGYGVISEIDAPKSALPLEGPLDIEFGYLGFEIEYIGNPDAFLHYTVYTLIGGGATNFVKDVGSVFKSNEQSGETDFLFVLEPAAFCEMNVTPWLRLNAGVAYRLVNGVEQKDLKNSDFSGPSADLILKFGKF